MDPFPLFTSYAGDYFSRSDGYLAKGHRDYDLSVPIYSEGVSPVYFLNIWPK